MTHHLEPYYRRDLALIHHKGFGFHADACAPGILELLAPVRARDGLVLELGCGSGLLTRYLVDARHRVVATDASPAMLELAREELGDRVELRPLAFPDDPVPEADAIVGVGHALNYVDSVEDVEASLVAIARALRPGGVLAFDLCDLRWGEVRRDQRPIGWVGEDWALVTVSSVPAPDRYVREMATFTRNDDGSWRRDDERHDNVLLETSSVPALLADHGVDARIEPAFGDEELPDGLVAVVGEKRYE